MIFRMPFERARQCRGARTQTVLVMRMPGGVRSGAAATRTVAHITQSCSAAPQPVHESEYLGDRLKKIRGNLRVEIQYRQQLDKLCVVMKRYTRFVRQFDDSLCHEPLALCYDTGRRGAAVIFERDGSTVRGVVFLRHTLTSTRLIA